MEVEYLATVMINESAVSLESDYAKYGFLLKFQILLAYWVSI